MTDDRVQDSITAYATGNWQARVSANVLPDATGLMNPAHHSPAFSSMGFGRVTLGREKFLEYSAERLARSVIDRLLTAHLEADPLFSQRTEQEWIAVNADKVYQQFIRDLALNEDTEEHNDVIDALRPDSTRQMLTDGLTRGIFDRLSDPRQLDKNGGLDLTTWSQRLLTEWTTRAPDLIREEQNARQRLLDEWIADVPSKILNTVARYAANDGLPVVVKLLERVERNLKGAVDGLLAEAQTHDQWVAELPSLVSEELQSAPNQTSIRPAQDAVAGAVDRIGQALGWACEARLRTTASALIAELRTDFLAPLRSYLDGASEELSQRVHARKTADDRENDYEFWPRRDDKTVPRKYTPAPNERLLVEHTEYPEEFRTLVRNTSTDHGERFADAILDVVADLIVGVEPVKVKEGDETSWTMVNQARTWKPAVAR